MANVLLTTYCNRNCAYCFAQGKVDLNRDKGDPSKNLSMDALEKIISFYKRSLLRRFSILGGEPTLHPQFTTLLDRVLAEPSFKMVLVFTNGLIPEPVLDYLENQQDDRLQIALNFNAPSVYPQEQLDHIEETLKRVGPKVGLGINIYKAGQDYKYLVDAINEYDMVRHIRLGLTHPIVGAGNRYARRKDFPAIAEDIVAFAKVVERNNISFSFDCGFEFCMFSLEQHKTLLGCGIRFTSRCDPIVDIGPDLNVWRCFPMLGDVCGKLDAFETRNDIIDHFNKKYGHIKRMGNRPECPQCRYQATGLCSGGCLARTLISFKAK